MADGRHLIKPVSAFLLQAETYTLAKSVLPPVSQCKPH